MDDDELDLAFEGRLVEWRGPAPYWFVEIPPEVSDDVKEAARGIEYWGQVPVTARVLGTTFTTALFPKDGVYLLPLKVAVRRAAGLDVDDPAARAEPLTVDLSVGRADR